MNCFIRFDGHWLNSKSIHNGWQAAFTEDARFARSFKSRSEAEQMIDRLASYRVNAEIVECPYSCPA